jgi:hypothetical protein
MKFKPLTAAMLGAALVSGCGDDPDIDARNASVEEVQEQVAKTDVRPRAGRWRQELKFVSIDMPDMPEEARAMMGKAGDTVHTGYTCLTPEQAAQPDASLFQQAAKGCTYDHFRMGGGTIDAKMTCTEGPQRQVSTMKGSYSAEAYDLALDMQGEMMGRPMHSKMALKMTRVGECTGDEDGKPAG